ncbi:uncharacterized protein BCR38DRAFT_498470 [Pseudomassariella vexata]|uniref:Uncharacterized protein n=1 Tax=Pseudomassariella vexata TaxID=1141098 RepID=A0A1Y2DKJ6_9PEZI|nr:uncharacterized protein BCR38DRAFT_498470 [Pseudomassariella vexata]ORY59684.1 hypothetical protein BCR38DRAFT_498470 [Pseudomassariella vexata]
MEANGGQVTEQQQLSAVKMREYMNQNSDTAQTKQLVFILRAMFRRKNGIVPGGLNIRTICKDGKESFGHDFVLEAPFISTVLEWFIAATTSGNLLQELSLLEEHRLRFFPADLLKWEQFSAGADQKVVNKQPAVAHAITRQDDVVVGSVGQQVGDLAMTNKTDRAHPPQPDAIINGVSLSNMLCSNTRSYRNFLADRTQAKRVHQLFKGLLSAPVILNRVDDFPDDNVQELQDLVRRLCEAVYNTKDTFEGMCATVRTLKKQQEEQNQTKGKGKGRRPRDDGNTGPIIDLPDIVVETAMWELLYATRDAQKGVNSIENWPGKSGLKPQRVEAVSRTFSTFMSRFDALIEVLMYHKGMCKSLFDGTNWIHRIAWDPWGELDLKIGNKLINQTRDLQVKAGNALLDHGQLKVQKNQDGDYVDEQGNIVIPDPYKQMSTRLKTALIERPTRSTSSERAKFARRAGIDLRRQQRLKAIEEGTPAPESTDEHVNEGESNQDDKEDDDAEYHLPGTSRKRPRRENAMPKSRAARLRGATMAKKPSNSKTSIPQNEAYLNTPNGRLVTDAKAANPAGQTPQADKLQLLPGMAPPGFRTNQPPNPQTDFGPNALSAMNNPTSTHKLQFPSLGCIMAKSHAQGLNLNQDTTQNVPLFGTSGFASTNAPTQDRSQYVLLFADSEVASTNTANQTQKQSVNLVRDASVGTISDATAQKEFSIMSPDDWFNSGLANMVIPVDPALNLTSSVDPALDLKSPVDPALNLTSPANLSVNTSTTTTLASKFVTAPSSPPAQTERPESGTNHANDSANSGQQGNSAEKNTHALNWDLPSYDNMVLDFQGNDMMDFSSSDEFQANADAMEKLNRWIQETADFQ